MNNKYNKTVSSIFREEPYSDYEIDRAFSSIRVEAPLKARSAKKISMIEVDMLEDSIGEISIC